MNDSTTKQPLRVLTAGRTSSYFVLPFTQLDEVRRLLETNGIRYWVSDSIISFNGAPEVAYVYLGRREDVPIVQKLLDDAN